MSGSVGILPQPQTQFCDANGAPLAGGSVATYVVGTTTPAATYQDYQGTIANTNPVILDATGRASIWGGGNFRFIVKDVNGNTIYDANTSGGSSFSGAVTVGGLLTAGSITTSGSLIAQANASVTGSLTAGSLSTAGGLTAGTSSLANLAVSGALTAGAASASTLTVSGAMSAGAAGVSSLTAAGDITSATSNGGPLAGFRNVLMNGGMDVWQRGASFSSPSSTYTADRWAVGYNETGATVVVSQQAASEQALLDLGLSNWLNYNQSVAGTGGSYKQIIQRVERVRTLAGRTATLSFWAKATGSVSASVFLAQFFGTGGSPSPSVNLAGQAAAITTTPTKFSFTFALPTISGKTLGSNGDDNLQVVFTLPLNSTMNISITGVQLETGSVATPFEYRPIGTELNLCQRYWQAGEVFASGSGSTGAAAAASTALQPTMRIAPTVSITNNASANISSQTLAANSMIAFVTGAVTATGNWTIAATYSASAEL